MAGTVLSVDFAARFSAGVVMDAAGVVLHEFDSWAKAPLAFVREVAEVALAHNVDRIIIEDVPYGISRQAMIKPVLRLQGMLIHELAHHNLLTATLFVNPATWQRTFEGVYGGKASGALAAAQKLGYNPPDMLERHADTIPDSGPTRSKMREQLKKATTDYTDAFLMCKWAHTFDSLIDMRAVSGVQEPAI